MMPILTYLNPRSQQMLPPGHQPTQHQPTQHQPTQHQAMRHLSYSHIVLCLILAFTSVHGKAATSYQGLFNSGYPIIHKETAYHSRLLRNFAEDEKGRIWIAGSIGLAWYDGFEFYTAYNSKGSKAFTGEFITQFSHDGKSGFWILNKNGGLHFYHIESRKEFRNLNQGDIKVRSFIKNSKNNEAILATNQGFWSAQYNNGSIQLSKLDHYPKARDVKHMQWHEGHLYYSNDSKIFKLDTESLIHEPILSYTGSLGEKMLIDTSQNVWLEIDNDLVKFEQGSEAFRLEDIGVSDLIQLRNGEIWLSAPEIGFGVIDPSNGNILRHLNESIENDLSAKSDLIPNIYQDTRGIIWGSRFNKQIMRINPGHQTFSNIVSEPQKIKSIPSNSIYYILLLNNGDILLGHSAGGISVLAPNGEVKQTLLPENTQVKSDTTELKIPPGSIYTMVEDGEGNIWVSIRGKGIYKIDSDFRKIQLMHSDKDNNNRYFNLVFSEDRVLFASGEKGIFHFDHNNGKLIDSLRNHKIDLHRKANHTSLDKDGNLWVGGREFLAVIPKGEKQAKKLYQTKSIPIAMEITNLFSVFSGVSQQAYVILEEKLFSANYNKNTNIIEFLEIPLNEKISGRFYEDNGFLWSPYARIDLSKNKVEHFGRADGLFPNLDYYFARARLPDGSYLFGSPDGLIVQRPETLKPWQYDVPMVTTAIDIDGATYDGDWNNIVLNPDNNSLTVATAALDYTEPESTRYAYRIKGYQDNWIESDYQGRRFSLSNFSAGDYLLEIKGSNRLGVWGSKPIHINIHVLPQWYETYWFRLLTLLFITLSIWIIFRLRVRQLRERQLELEELVDTRTNDLSRSLQELSSTKDQLIESEKHASLGRLIRGVSHELNTPIGILKSSNSLISETSQTIKTSLQDGSLTQVKLTSFVDSVLSNTSLLGKNIERMANLTMRFKESLAEDTQMPLHDANIKDVINNCALKLNRTLEQKKIDLQLDCSDSITLYSYPSILNDVLEQLFENSIQHGFSGDVSLEQDAKIYIKVRKIRDIGVKILFADNGRGMDEETQAEVFEPFFTQSTDAINIGLGLHSVVNWTTQSLRGQITCRSRPGQGTMFILKLKHHPVSS